MKSVYFEQYGKPEVLKIGDLPEPKPKANEVLIQVKAAAINPKDCLVRKGKFKIATGNRFPQQLGHDLAGVIVAKGKSVNQYEIGQQIFGMCNGWKARCYAELAAIDAQEIFLMPPQLSYEEAASIPLAALTALQAMRDLGKLQSGQSILINGASGGVGVYALQIAKILGANITAVSSAKNHELCYSLGAHKMIDYHQEDLLKIGQKFDLFFDVFGNYHFQKVRHLLKPKGRYVSTVPNTKNVLNVFKTLPFAQKSKLVVVKSKAKDLIHLHKYVEEGKLKPVIDACYPLEEVQAAHTYVETRRARGKVILQVKEG